MRPYYLFKDAPKVLLEKIELIVRLIRSKGVGVFFVTQNPTDIPDSVASQLGNRIQHGLRAFTPKELKTVTVVAETLMWVRTWPGRLHIIVQKIFEIVQMISQQGVTILLVEQNAKLALEISDRGRLCDGVRQNHPVRLRAGAAGQRRGASGPRFARR